MRVVVIGAGPIGLAAALGARRRGMDVTVLEREHVGASIRRWGATRLFSPLAMNVPPGAAALIPLPGHDAMLTGPEYVDTVLAPLAHALGCVRERHAVVSVTRAGMSRAELVGHPLRAERPFRILVETPDGEQELEADAVLDASGTSMPLAIGVRGERAASAQIARTLGDVFERRTSFAGRRVALVGHGHSATNALAVLAGVAAETPATRVVWIVRTPNMRPAVEVASDPLPERHRIVSGANELAAKPPAWLRVERRAHVRAIEPVTGALRVALSGDRSVEVDHVIAMIGARADLSIASELALDIAPATEGAGGIARRLANVTDCLSVPALSPGDLASGEPGFHLIGAKSYGRARTFLLQNGFAQLEIVLDGLAAARA